MNLYELRSRLKFVIIIVAVLIGLGSLYYTNRLVQKLEKREKRLIHLFAEAQEFVATADPSNNFTFLFKEIIGANESIPVILTDAQGNHKSDRNLDLPDGLSPEERQKRIEEELQRMKEAYPPIEVEYGHGMKDYIYYRNSALITQLKYYPYVQLSVITIFILMGYLAFNYSRKAEQNRVWAGMAKETAHQLGTPISSLMAWVEYLEASEEFSHPQVLGELEKDINRLRMVTARFSNVGSIPTLKKETLQETLQEVVGYLEKRISKKVKFSLVLNTDPADEAEINRSLFEWVVENLCKNAVDAMDRGGHIHLELRAPTSQKFQLDIRDDGKGMTRKQARRIFDPGFSTKQRGWGLGLTLAKRIIEQYHQGKLFVLKSEPGVGTTFRIVLLRQVGEKRPAKSLGSLMAEG